MRRLVVAALIALALILAACGDEDDDGGDAGATTDVPAEDVGPSRGGGGEQEPAEKPDKPGTEITVSGSQFGEIIFDSDNQAIYLFDAETSSKPECYGECAEAWPPVLTEGEPVATGAAEQKLLGTTKRDDGSTQVTYAGQPLYYYAHEGPGQVLCHNVSEFGGLWLVLDAKGDALS
jgi:predicted lipoprotein with Yx(FWY)xxD motif